MQDKRFLKAKVIDLFLEKILEMLCIVCFKEWIKNEYSKIDDLNLLI